MLSSEPRGLPNAEIWYVKCIGGLRRLGELNEQVRALAEGDAGTASDRTYQHIMGANPVKEESG